MNQLDVSVGQRPENQAEPETTPEVWWEGLGSYARLTGCLGSKLFGYQEAVEAIEDAGETHCFPPQGGRNGVDGAQLWNQDLPETTHHKV